MNDQFAMKHVKTEAKDLKDRELLVYDIGQTIIAFGGLCLMFVAHAIICMLTGTIFKSVVAVFLLLIGIPAHSVFAHF
jgi:uncharacterized Tic20 family protein